MHFHPSYVDSYGVRLNKNYKFQKFFFFWMGVNNWYCSFLSQSTRTTFSYKPIPFLLCELVLCRGRHVHLYIIHHISETFHCRNLVLCYIVSYWTTVHACFCKFPIECVVRPYGTLSQFDWDKSCISKIYRHFKQNLIKISGKFCVIISTSLGPGTHWRAAISKHW